ncbi:MAG: hypothetical protein HC802_18425 [Caldilineaceae bacterium]|nr:hypothetical protein [Caldilineaceae bacterium]
MLLAELRAQHAPKALAEQQAEAMQPLLFEELQEEAKVRCRKLRNK